MPHKTKRPRSRDPYRSRMYKAFASRFASKSAVQAVGRELEAYKEQTGKKLDQLIDNVSKIQESSKKRESVIGKFFEELVEGAGSEAGKRIMQYLFDFKPREPSVAERQTTIGPGSALGLSTSVHGPSTEAASQLTITPETTAPGTADTGARPPAPTVTRIQRIRDYTYRPTQAEINEYRAMTLDEFISKMFNGLRDCKSYAPRCHKLLVDYFEHPEHFPEIALPTIPPENDENTENARTGGEEQYLENVRTTERNKQKVREEMLWIDGHAYYAEDLPEFLASRKLVRKLIKTLASEKRYKNKLVVFDNTPDGTIKIAKALARMYDIENDDPIYVEFTGFYKDHAKKLGYADGKPKIGGRAKIVEDDEGRIKIECHDERLVDERTIEEYILTENRGDAIAVNFIYKDRLGIGDFMQTARSNGRWLEFYIGKAQTNSPQITSN